MLYQPCQFCYEWLCYSKYAAYHNPTCPGKPYDEELMKTNKELVIASQTICSMAVLYSSNIVASDLLIREVFPTMKKNEICQIAQSDQLIVALGDTWLSKNFAAKRMHKNRASYRMRLAARLLKELGKVTKYHSGSYMEFLDPEYFDMMVKSTLNICTTNDNAELQNPSTS